MKLKNSDKFEKSYQAYLNSLKTKNYVYNNLLLLISSFRSFVKNNPYYEQELYNSWFTGQAQPILSRMSTYIKTHSGNKYRKHKVWNYNKSLRSSLRSQLRDKNRELNTFRARVKSLQESHNKFKGQIQALENVKELTISLQSQLSIMEQVLV